jgi:hypothetical protein
MASSRDVLNAFRAHVARLVAGDEVDAARAAWEDFVSAVVPTFPENHRAEAMTDYDAFVREYRPVAPSSPKTDAP